MRSVKRYVTKCYILGSEIHKVTKSVNIDKNCHYPERNNNNWLCYIAEQLAKLNGINTQSAKIQQPI